MTSLQNLCVIGASTILCAEVEKAQLHGPLTCSISRRKFTDCFSPFKSCNVCFLFKLLNFSLYHWYWYVVVFFLVI